MNKAFNFFLVFFTFCLASINASAQKVTEGDLFVLKGQVVNGENDETLPLVTVYNKTMQQGVTSNTSGVFSIKFHLGDSIVFQSLGFDNFVWKEDAVVTDELYVTIRMQPKTYELKSVDVTAFRTAEDFKKHILAMDMPEEKKLEIPGLEMIRAEPSGEGKVAISGPISFFYDKFSRRANDQRKFLITKTSYEKQQMLSVKLAEVVKKIIEVEDPEVLEEFIGFCNLHDSFIENANEYELIVAVNKCYDEFKVFKDN